MSGFRKKAKSKSKSSVASSSLGTSSLQLRGTKPWINSSTLVSTGQRDLDVILGGGQTLGTSLLVLEDRFSDYGSTICRYWAAEGVSNGQQVILVDFDDVDDDGDDYNFEAFVKSLPLDMNLQRAEKKREAALAEIPAEPPLASLTLVEEGDEDDFDEEKVDTIGDGHLKVAWQYKKSMQSAPGAAPQTHPHFCHSFDLSKRLQSSHLELAPIMKRNLCAESRSHASLFKSLVSVVSEALSTPVGGGNVIKLILRRPPYLVAASALVLFKSYVLSRKLPVATFVSVRPWEATLGEASAGCDAKTSSLSSLTQLIRSADTALRVDGFSGLMSPPPPEFRDFVSIFSVIKVHSSRRPLAMRWGIKRDRRKMHIKMLHLPPEDYSERGSVGGGARSGGGGTGGGGSGSGSGEGKAKRDKLKLSQGLPCGGGGHHGATNLDF